MKQIKRSVEYVCLFPIKKTISENPDPLFYSKNE